MNDRAWASFQRFLANYDKFRLEMAETRDRFFESYASKPGYALSTTLGRMHDLAYALYRMQSELGSLYREYDGRTSEAAAFISQERFFQNELGALREKSGKLHEEKYDRYKRAVSVLQVKIQALEKELSGLQTENQALKMEAASRGDEKAVLSRALDSLKSQAQEAADRLASHQKHMAEAMEQHRRERERLQNRIYELEAQRKSQEDARESWEAEKRSLESAFNSRLDKYKSALNKTGSENAALRAGIEKVRQERDKSRREIDELKKEKKGQESPHAAPGQTGGQMESPAQAKEPKPAPRKPIPEPATGPQEPAKALGEDEDADLLENFVLARTPGSLSGGKEELVKRIEKAARMEGILNFLDSSANSAADSFKRQLERCLPKLGKLQGKAAFMDDDENLSAELSREFFKIISNNVLSNIMSAIARGHQGDPAFYGDFLKLLNKWLEDCGVYSRMVRAGSKPCEQDYDDMNFIGKTVHDPALHGVMERVERLPYYMDYLDEYGERASYHYEGIAIVLKNDEKRGQAQNGAE